MCKCESRMNPTSCGGLLGRSDCDLAALSELGHGYDLRDPDAYWLADHVQLRVRTQVADPSLGAVSMTVHGYIAETTVSVVPLQRLILPRRYARALERMRYRFIDLDSAQPGRSMAKV